MWQMTDHFIESLQPIEKLLGFGGDSLLLCRGSFLPRAHHHAGAGVRSEPIGMAVVEVPVEEIEGTGARAGFFGRIVGATCAVVGHF
jgi:hypothetical protein